MAQNDSKDMSDGKLHPSAYIDTRHYFMQTRKDGTPIRIKIKSGLEAIEVIQKEVSAGKLVLTREQEMNLWLAIHYFNAFDPANLITGGKLDIAKVSKAENLCCIELMEFDSNGDLDRIKLCGGSEMRHFSVYLVKAENGLTKIGVSRDPKKRFDGLCTMSPIDLELIFYASSLWGRRLEKHFHERFKDKRIKGEWFNLDDEDIESIKAKCPH